MQILFSIVFIFSFLFCNSPKIEINPILFANSYSSGGIIDTKSDVLYWLGWGIIGKYNHENLNIESNLLFTRYQGLGQLNTFSNIQALSSSGHRGSGAYEAQSTYMKATYTHQNFQFDIGRFSQSWGPGSSKIFLSNKIPPFAQYAYSWKLNKKYHFFFMHGKLNSGLYTYDTYEDGGVWTDKSPRPRFIGAHRLLITLSDRLTLGLNELVIYGNRAPELAYNLPFVLFYSLQNYFSDLDNVMVGIDLEFKIKKNFIIYSALLIDDLSMSKMFSDNHNNKVAFQIGSLLENLFFDKDQLLMELIWSDNRLYTHKYNINYAYSSSGDENNFISNPQYPIGFWGGPHSEHAYLSYKVERLPYSVTLSYSYTKRGQVTDEMILNDHTGDYVNSEHRFTGPIEQLDFVELKISRIFFKKIHLQLAIQKINWINPGFDPFDPSDDTIIINELDHLNKYSFNFGLLYNFNWAGIN